jgi:hypothetical protein
LPYIEVRYFKRQDVVLVDPFWTRCHVYRDTIKSYTLQDPNKNKKVCSRSVVKAASLTSSASWRDASPYIVPPPVVAIMEGHVHDIIAARGRHHGGLRPRHHGSAWSPMVCVAGW